MRTLVLGVGNPWNGDDGAGPETARRLAARVPETVTVTTVTADLTSILDLWDGFARVFLVDATRSAGCPGTLRRFDVRRRPLPAEHFGLSSHGFGLAAMLELARRFDRLPPVTIVYGVEGAHFGPGEALSPRVEYALHVLVTLLLLDIDDRNGRPLF